MYFIGTALVLIALLDFGLYVLGNVSSSQLSFLPQILVFGDKDFTGVAVFMLGYFLREQGGSGEKEADAEAVSAEDAPSIPAEPEKVSPSDTANTKDQTAVASWGFIDSWIRNSLLGTLFATISGSQNWFHESPGLRFTGRLFILAMILLVLIAVFA